MFKNLTDILTTDCEVIKFNNEQYFMSVVLGLLTITSFNFWRKPNYSWRRIVDRVYAKIAFTICFVNGIRYYYLFTANTIFFLI